VSAQKTFTDRRLQIFFFPPKLFVGSGAGSRAFDPVPARDRAN
jgi:hypothetical protein